MGATVRMMEKQSGMNCKTLITGSNPVVASKANLQDLCGFTDDVRPLFL
jgi:hypothetical protein